MFYLGLLVLGFSVGLISTALGLGGGVLMVPAFLTFLNMDAGTAKGSSLFIIVFVAAANVWRLNRGDEDRHWRLAGLMAVGSIVGAYLAGYGTSLLAGKADYIIIWIFVAFMGLAAIRTFLLKPIKVREQDVRRNFWAALAIGFATGAASGATGIGGGAVLVPLALLAGVVSNSRVAALSNTVMVATCTSAALAHFMADKVSEMPWTYGQVNVATAPFVFIGAQLAGPLGKKLNQTLTLRRRKIVMGLIQLVIAVKLILSVI